MTGEAECYSRVYPICRAKSDIGLLEDWRFGDMVAAGTEELNILQTRYQLLGRHGIPCEEHRDLAPYVLRNLTWNRRVESSAWVDMNFDARGQCLDVFDKVIRDLPWHEDKKHVGFTAGGGRHGQGRDRVFESRPFRSSQSAPTGMVQFM